MRSFSIKVVATAIALFTGFAALADENANVNAMHNLLVNVGFTTGGLGLGADYENGSNRSFGWGGYVRLYPGNKDRDLGTAPEVNTFGAFVRPHFTRGAWDLYVSPGFGLITYDNKVNGAGHVDKTTFGPAMMLGLMYQFQSKMAFGVEETSLYGWFNEDIRGLLSQEMMAKFRFSF